IHTTRSQTVSVTTNGPQTVNRRQTDFRESRWTGGGSTVTGAYTRSESSHDNSAADETMTNQTLTVHALVTSDGHGTSQTLSGNSVTGSFSRPQTGGSLSTRQETTTNQTETVVSATTVRGDTSANSSGNTVTGAFDITTQATNVSDRNDTTSDDVPTLDAQGVTHATNRTTRCTAHASDVSSSRNSGNSITGTFTSEERTLRTSRRVENWTNTAVDLEATTVTQAGSSDAASVTTQVASSTGNSVTGAFGRVLTVHTEGSRHESSADQTQATVADTATGGDSVTTSNGNSVTGAFHSFEDASDGSDQT